MRVDVNGVGIHYEVTGEGPSVVLLHGFPDSGRLWRHQVPRLAGAGFRVIVPDLRGYGRSDKPTEVEAYAMPALVADVLAVIEHAGASRAHVVGHDWGAAIGWVLASVAGPRVYRFAALSVGHPAGRRAAGLAQVEKSWYMLLFQFAGIAESWLSRDGWANFRAWAAHPDADAVIADLEADGSLTPGLNYYRANLHPAALFGSGPSLSPVRSATLGIWGSGDVALTETQMLASAGLVVGPWRYERLDGPGHWLPLEAPDEISRLLIDFLSDDDRGGR